MGAPSFRDVVAEHHVDSDAILVAGREPCLSIAHDEATNVSGRSFHIITPEELGQLEPRPSWIMAVLLCPGDEASSVAAWLQAGGRDPRRVLFYLHKDTDPRQALAPWHEAGLAIHSTWTIRTWRELHKHLGGRLERPHLRRLPPTVKTDPRRGPQHRTGPVGLPWTGGVVVTALRQGSRPGRSRLPPAPPRHALPDHRG